MTAIEKHLRWRVGTILACMFGLWLLCGVALARAGTYTIYDCPSAGSSSAGPWQLSGGSTQRTTCSGGLGDFLGLFTGSMPVDATWAMSVNAPQGETLTQSSIYWYVAGRSSGGDVFSEEWSGGSELENGENTLDNRYVPESHTLPAGATSIVIAVYCSNDDYSNPCNYPSAQTPVLEMLGSAITVSDATPPAGGLTGGGLDGNGPVSGTQSISYSAGDSLAGIYSVQLLVDGTLVATNSYASSCSFTNFQPCPASEPGSLSWDTANVPNGAHEVELQITNAAGDTTVIGDHAITTNNSPTFSSAPTISGSPAVGQTLSTTPGGVDSDPAAGSLKKSGRWLRCDASGGSCTAIASATSTSYSVSSADEHHTLRYQETVANNDGSAESESEAFGPITSASSGGGSGGPGGGSGSGSGSGVNGAGGGSGANGANGVNGSNGSNGANGSLTVNLPGSNQGAVLGSAVKWRVSLSVSPRRVRRHSKIKLAGSVSTSPRPAQGKLIYLQARSVRLIPKGKGKRRRSISVYGKWISFEIFRANGNGSFASTYTFKLGGRHTYQFQAVAPAEGQFRNPTGISNIITIKEA